MRKPSVRPALLLGAAMSLAAQNATFPSAVDDILQGASHPPIRVVITPRASTPSGVTPAQMKTAYGFNAITNQGQGQTIAIVDAYDDPTIENDLGVFSSQFGLPACTTANGCFKKIYANGRKPLPNGGWSLEMALDVEWAHAIAPQAKIILVEAANNLNNSLYTAVDVAVQNGASVVSMSWGGGEARNETQTDSHFNAAGVTFTASSGDGGHGIIYPAASPFVIGVGGTTLSINPFGTYLGETAWSGSGGGSSRYEPEPVYQTSVQQTGRRGVPDVAYDADPATGVPVYSGTLYQGQKGWFQVGGTSMSAPQWAALLGIVNSSRAASGKAPVGNVLSSLYSLAGNLHDIVSGSNGTCALQCNAVAGYDFVTGLGSPKADQLIPALVALP